MATTLEEVKNPVVVGAAIHRVVSDLIMLHSQTKQAHWNVKGPFFEPIHRFLDEMAAAYQEAVDELAERMLALDIPADGRLSTVLRDSRLEEFPAGIIGDREVVDLMIERVSSVSKSARLSQQEVAELDPVTEDLLLELIHTLEKQLWMLKSQARR